ncbi:MAG: glycoside hydrolase family 16 protein, partial [Candidatus Microsaccharimonas sp.]
MIVGLTYIKDSLGAQAKDRVVDGYLENWGLPVWRDEFDYIDPVSGEPGVDPAKWNVRGRDDLGLLFDAAEPSRDQVSVEEGILHVRGAWLDEPYTKPSNPGNVPVVTHKTGYIDTRSINASDVSYAQQYGRWEIRAKMPTGPQTYGALSAFWLRNSLSGEIDIVEAWGYNTTPTEETQLPGASTLTIHSHTMGSSAEGYQKTQWRANELLGDYINMNWSYISKNLPNTPAFADFRTWAFEY